MLARQGWRLLNNPDSLIYRVLKERYFPDGDLLGAIAKPGISYSWRSILRGIDLLKEGLIWRVGDGSSIRIWEDPWIPNVLTRRPRLWRGQALFQKVSELLDPAEGGWDEQLIRDLFTEEDAELILSIPIQENMDDTPAWHFDPKGRFLLNQPTEPGFRLVAEI